MAYLTEDDFEWGHQRALDIQARSQFSYEWWLHELRYIAHLEQRDELAEMTEVLSATFHPIAAAQTLAQLVESYPDVILEELEGLYVGPRARLGYALRRCWVEITDVVVPALEWMLDRIPTRRNAKCR